MKKSLINILSVSCFVFCGLLLEAQDFRGGDIRFTYQDSPLNIDINVNLYFYTAEGETGLDSVVITTEDLVYTVGVAEIVSLNRGVSVYRYSQNHNFLSIDGSKVISVLNTPAVEVDHQALIQDSIGISLQSYMFNQHWFDPNFAVWEDFLFDYFINEAGELVFKLSGYDQDGNGEVGFGFSTQLLSALDQGWYEYPAPLEDLQLNAETGSFRWQNPPGPGKYMLGFDLHGLYPNSTVLSNMFTRYLVIELTEEDFMVSTGTDIFARTEPTIYPNPANNSIKVEYAALQEDLNLTVNNTQGQIVYQAELPIGNKSAEIDVSTWPAGIYWLELSSAEGRVTKKLIVE